MQEIFDKNDTVENLTHLEFACKLLNREYNHVLEFGVFFGKTLTLLKNTLSDKFNLFGFDSFEGLPEDWLCFDGTVAGHGVCTKNFFTTNGAIPEIEGVKIYSGWFEDTIKEYLKIAQPISLLHVDCDLYSSTKTVLYNLNDYIKPDTIIVFDEWYYNGDPNFNDHEQKCFFEWVKDFDREFELIEHHCPVSSNEQQIVKIKK
jgi:hypothetical protein